MFEAASGWGGYGWVTPEGEQTTDSSQPVCLTKDPGTNTMSFKDCAYQEVDGEKKVLDNQLWKFTIYAYQQQVGNIIETGPVVNRMINKADDNDDCINITGMEMPTCKMYWLGTVFEDNFCRKPPSEAPGVCSTE